MLNINIVLFHSQFQTFNSTNINTTDRSGFILTVPNRRNLTIYTHEAETSQDFHILAICLNWSVILILSANDIHRCYCTANITQTYTHVERPLKRSDTKLSFLVDVWLSLICCEWLTYSNFSTADQVLFHFK